MKTIGAFEDALGRKALAAAAARRMPGAGRDDHYVQRLRIYPHALRNPNKPITACPYG